MFGPMKLSPSILSADFMNLEQDIAMIAGGGADYIHVDVMDGHFVPNLTIGVPVVKALKRITAVPLDVHLMITNPARQVPWYLEAGADLVTIHIESDDDPLPVLASIRAAGAQAGISLNPETPVSALAPCIDKVDLILVMSVHPGFSGQSFIEECVDKVAQLSTMCADAGVNPLIEVDGGLNPQTVRLMAAAGADVIVAGNAVFAQTDPIAAMRAIRRAGDEAAGDSRLRTSAVVRGGDAPDLSRIPLSDSLGKDA